MLLNTCKGNYFVLYKQQKSINILKIMKLSRNLDMLRHSL